MDFPAMAFNTLGPSASCTRQSDCRFFSALHQKCQPLASVRWGSEAHDRQDDFASLESESTNEYAGVEVDRSARLGGLQPRASATIHIAPVTTQPYEREVSSWTTKSLPDYAVSSLLRTARCSLAFQSASLLFSRTSWLVSSPNINTKQISSRGSSRHARFTPIHCFIHLCFALPNWGDEQQAVRTTRRCHDLTTTQPSTPGPPPTRLRNVPIRLLRRCMSEKGGILLQSRRHLNPAKLDMRQRPMHHQCARRQRNRGLLRPGQPIRHNAVMY
jgi:hypothetical protein